MHANEFKPAMYVQYYFTSILVSIENLSDQMQSVSLTEEQTAAAAAAVGDLDALDFRPRISLAMLLDPVNTSKDWKALAERLDLSHLIGGLQSMTSPTKELLNLYEVVDCVMLYILTNASHYV